MAIGLMQHTHSLLAILSKRQRGKLDGTDGNLLITNATAKIAPRKENNMSEELKQKLLELAYKWRYMDYPYSGEHAEYYNGKETATRSCGEELEELLTKG
ncbi:MAG TPA: hypothetical protein VM577_21345 [Anaerovoracaceae bacterium]|nr:hypothetical protein [Anaerovoracaceae bacterium]